MPHQFVERCERVSVNALTGRDPLCSLDLTERLQGAGKGAVVRARGFSLIELVLVLAIAAVVLGFGIPVYQRYMERTRVLEATTELGELSKTVKAWERTNGSLPSTLAAAGLSKNDPWGNPYMYFNLHAVSGNGQARKDKKLAPLNSDFDLYSVGRDGLTQENLGHANSRDDVVRARDGGFIGSAEEFDP
jgi:general secretion pathway protein G